MRSNQWWAMLALAAVVAGSASTRAGDLSFSDFDVQLVSHQAGGPTQDRRVKAAFLADDEELLFEPLRPTSPGFSMPMGDRILRGQSNGFLRKHSNQSNGCCEACGSGTCDCASSQHGVNFEHGSCGECCPDSTCDSTCSCGDECCPSCDMCCEETPGMGVYYAELQAMWMRVHLPEDVAGKLSEQYEVSPRVVFGYETAHGIGARLRWWHYGHRTEILGTTDGIRFEWDVYDAEATSRFSFRKSDLVVAGGARWLSAGITTDGDTVDTGMLGLTFAIDLRTEICSSCRRQWASVGGARFSTFGGNWEGDGFFAEERDDNVVVQELYGGVEYTCRTRKGHDIYARLVLEIQNWHSDVMGNNTSADSIGFFGPGIHVGASF